MRAKTSSSSITRWPSNSRRGGQRSFLWAFLIVFVVLYAVNTWLIYEALALFPFPNLAYRPAPDVQSQLTHTFALVAGTPRVDVGESSIDAKLFVSSGDSEHASVRAVVEAPIMTRIGVFAPLLGLKPSAGANATSQTAQRRRIERMAMQGWRLTAEALMGSAPLKFYVHVYGVVEAAAHCDPAWDDGGIADSCISCLVLPAHCLHRGYQSTPTMDCIFDTMAKLAGDQQYDYIVLANGDLLFSPGAFAASMQSLVECNEQKVVLVGQRTDATWNDELWGQVDETSPLHLEAYTSLHEAALSPTHGAVRHPDFGVDYFIMSTSIIPTDFPPFLIGRFRWDNALLAQFLTEDESSGVVIVDGTSALPVLHLGSMYSSDPEYHYNRVGATYNDALVTKHFGELYKLGRIRNAAWRVDESRAQETPRRCIIRQRAPEDRPDHIPLLAIARANKGPLLLLAVLPHELPHALEWLRQVKQTWNASWFHMHYLFVALDEETFNALAVAAPGRVILEDMTAWPQPPTALSWKSFERLLELRAMPVAILSATALTISIRNDDDWLAKYADKATTCAAVLLRESSELLSVQPQIEVGMEFWRGYKARGGKQFKPGAEIEGVCWV